jgi:hypothetical protein
VVRNQLMYSFVCVCVVRNGCMQEDNSPWGFCLCVSVCVCRVLCVDVRQAYSTVDRVTPLCE